MHSKYLVKVSPLFPATPYHYNHQYDQDLRRIVCCDNKKPSSSSTDKHKKFHFKLPGDSTKWKFRDIDTSNLSPSLSVCVCVYLALKLCLSIALFSLYPFQVSYFCLLECVYVCFNKMLGNHLEKCLTVKLL